MAAVAVVATATASVVDTDVGGVDENSTEAVDNVSDTLIDAHDCGYTTKDGGEAIIVSTSDVASAFTATEETRT